VLPVPERGLFRTSCSRIAHAVRLDRCRSVVARTGEREDRDSENRRAGLDEHHRREEGSHRGRADVIGSVGVAVRHRFSVRPTKSGPFWSPSTRRY